MGSRVPSFAGTVICMFTRPCGSDNLWGEGGASSVIGWVGLEARRHRLTVGHPSQIPRATAKAPGRSERIDGDQTRMASVESRSAAIITHLPLHTYRWRRPMSGAMAGIDMAGIDVGKGQLDVSVDEGKARRFANTASGAAELVDWLSAWDQPLAICEATGGYELLVVESLRQGEIPVHIAHLHIAHPNQVRDFARFGTSPGPAVTRPRPTAWTPWCCPAMAGSSNRQPPCSSPRIGPGCKSCWGDGSSWWASGPRRRTGGPRRAALGLEHRYSGTSIQRHIDTAAYRVAGRGDRGVGARIPRSAGGERGVPPAA